MAIEPNSGWTVALVLIFFLFFLALYIWSTWKQKQKQREDRMKQLEKNLDETNKS
jgi:cbb3-type cytochrome oxidase subunit 3